MIFFQEDSFTYFQVIREIKTCLEYHMGIKSKVGLTQINSLSEREEKESKWLFFHCQTIEIAATKAVNEKLHWGINIQTNFNKLWGSH